MTTENKINGLLAKLIEELTPAQKEEAHKELTKLLLGDYVEKLHEANCLYNLGGEVRAVICTGEITYTINVLAERSTPEQYDMWMNQNREVSQ